MRGRRGKSAGLLLAIALLSGCSSAYVPARGPRLSLILKNGQPTYMRDGITFEGGALGGQIEEAVAGNPAAETEARSFKDRMLGGFCSVLGGGVGMLAGTAVMATGTAAARDADQADNKRIATGAAVALGGVAAYVVGFALMVSAQPHLYDAINIYNDGVDARRPRLPGPPLAQPAAHAAIPTRAAAAEALGELLPGETRAQQEKATVASRVTRDR